MLHILILYCLVYILCTYVCLTYALRVLTYVHSFIASENKVIETNGN